MLSHDIQVISIFFFITFDYLFDLITKIRVSNNYFILNL